MILPELPERPGALMRQQVEVSNSKLTRHEAEQIRQIAIWKSEPPNPFDEICRMITLPWARFLERIVPDWLVVKLITWSYAAARALANLDGTRQRVEFRKLRVDSQHRSLDRVRSLAGRKRVCPGPNDLSGGGSGHRRAAGS